MLDVDFAVCTDVRARLRGALQSRDDTGGIGRLARSGRAVFVVPAFEYVAQEDGNDWRSFPTDKEVRFCVTLKRSVSCDAFAS